MASRNKPKRQKNKEEQKEFETGTSKKPTILDINLRTELGIALKSLQKNVVGHAMCALKIQNCNGFAGYGIPFSQAFCQTEIIQDPWYPIGTIFNKGISVLDDFLSGTPQGDIKQQLCNKLIEFVFSDDSRLHLKSLKLNAASLNETQLAVCLSEHLLSALTLSKSYRLDKMMTKNSESSSCKCGCNRDVKDKFGDTTIGKENVWHGQIDVILSPNENSVPVRIEGSNEDFMIDDDDKSPNPVEVKKKELYDVASQIIAETIVFSFLQKKLSPSSDHFLIPCIGINAKEVVFYFYDAEIDVLLQTMQMDLFFCDEIMYPTIICIWLVVNYKYLGNGLTGDLRNISKSNFYHLAGDLIKAYENDLRFGNVVSSSHPPVLHQQLLDASKYCYPSNIEKHDVKN